MNGACSASQMSPGLFACAEQMRGRLMSIHGECACMEDVPYRSACKFAILPLHAFAQPHPHTSGISNLPNLLNTIPIH